MVRFSRRTVIVLAVTLVAVSALVASAFYVQLAVNSITLQLRGVFVSLGKDELTVLLAFNLRNPSLLSADVVKLPFSVELAEYPLGSGEVVVPLFVPSSGQTETAGQVKIPYDQLPGVTLSAIQQYLDLGTLNYRIFGTITLRFLLILDVTVPYDLRGDVFQAGAV
jgi:hypothetical protein